MASASESALENIISAYINSKYQEIPPTEEEFNQEADLMRQANSFLPVTDEEFINLKRRLREYVVVLMDTGVCLPDVNNGHKSWLPARRAEIEFFFWNRYKRFLEEVKHWNPRVTSKLGQVSEEILDQCGDPKGPDFHIRGLVLGDVQSGKTANYTALANKAVDAGYELIIVLAGIPELLRQQTQKRLDAELCGRQSNLYLDPKSSLKSVPVGVGRYGNDKQVKSFTSEANDFDANVLKSNDLSLDNVNCSILLVVKKNKTILNNLYNWLKNNNKLNHNGQIPKSLFLIDDEADNASVNTKKDPDTEPTAINGAIRNIVSLFSKSTYLAVTATPFANIFIDPTLEQDLFPADFIYALSAPTAYIGAERIFSLDGDKRYFIERINETELLGVIPNKHKKDLQVDNLPWDIYKAAYYFLLANAIRDYRGDTSEHRSMLIHVSRFINVQNQIAEILNVWLDQVKSDLRNYSKCSPERAEEIESIHELHIVWDEYHLSEKIGVSWDYIRYNYLNKAVAPIDVRAVNGRNGSTLDYDNHKEDGLRVIAVGGNTLSRGLTLEGLIVSYFYRNTNMYDTLMQMGRWFGYRNNYDDLVKIWLSQDAIDWYGQIQDATMDLRDQIERMRQANQSPRDFGLKVKQDPGSLIVTARNKMRTAKQMTVNISVSGRLLETPRLYSSLDIIQKNAELVEHFIDSLDVNGDRIPESEYKTFGNYFWEHVPGDTVAELVRSFKTHPWQMNYNSRGLSEFIQKNHYKNDWDVVLLKKGDGDPFDKTLKCGSSFLTIDHTEKRRISVNGNMLSVSGRNLKVGSGGSARIGLSEKQIKEIRTAYFNKNKDKKSLPDNAYLIDERNPILLIHIIQAEYDRDRGKYPKFLYALGLGFPQNSGGDRVAVYQVNLVELANWIGNEVEDDE